MQFRDLHRQYEMLKPQMDEAVRRVMDSGRYIMGDEVAELESRLAEYVGVRHCVACASGTDALRLSLMIAGIRDGDAVLVPDFTFFATAEVVLTQHATPIFVDVDPYTYNIDINDLQRKIASAVERGSRLRAIVAVDLFGLSADYERLRDIADHHGLLLIEDAAQGFGGTIRGRRNCSWGHMSATSFFPAKPLGCYGDGGALFTDNDEWAQMARSIIQHGKGTNKYENVTVGMNSRLDALQAAILKVKLSAFDDEMVRSQQIADHYTRALGEFVATPAVPEGYTSSWAQYTIRLESRTRREALKEALANRGVPSMVYYPLPLHQQPVFGGSVDDCPVAKHLSETVLSLPMHPYLSDEEAEQVVGAVRDFFSTQNKQQ